MLNRIPKIHSKINEKNDYNEMIKPNIYWNESFMLIVFAVSVLGDVSNVSVIKKKNFRCCCCRLLRSLRLCISVSATMPICQCSKYMSVRCFEKQIISIHLSFICDLFSKIILLKIRLKINFIIYNYLI